jgi:hypothetical protein
MSIQIINREEKNCPFIVCDHCKLEIFKAEEANAIWLGDPRREEGFRFDVGHVHKECDQPFQNAHPAPPGSQWFGTGLEHHLYTLLKNVEYDAQRAANTKRKVDNLG